jgi:hypothetical protein
MPARVVGIQASFVIPAWRAAEGHTFIHVDRAFGGKPKILSRWVRIRGTRVLPPTSRTVVTSEGLRPALQDHLHEHVGAGHKRRDSLLEHLSADFGAHAAAGP